MLETVISFINIKFPNETNGKGIRHTLRGNAVIGIQSQTCRNEKIHSSRLFLPDDQLMFGNWLEYRNMARFKREMLFGKRMVKTLPRNIETCLLV